MRSDSEIVRLANESFFLLFLLFAHYYFFSSIFRLSFLSFNVRPWSALLDAEYLLIIQMKGILISCELNPILLIDCVIII